MLLSEVVATAATVTATSSRLAKVEALGRAAAPAAARGGRADGRLPRRPRPAGPRRASGTAPSPALMGAPAETPSLTVADLDRLLDDLLAATGTGSAALRQGTLQHPRAARHRRRAAFVTRVLIGEMRTGALEGVLVDAVAKAVRRSRAPPSAGRSCSAATSARPPGSPSPVAPTPWSRSAWPSGPRSCRCWPPPPPTPPRRSPSPARHRSSTSSTARASRSTATATTSTSTPAASPRSPTGCPRSSRSSAPSPPTG